MTNDKEILRLLFKEEWRLHRELFNGSRFFLFPLLIMGMVFVGATAITQDWMSGLKTLHLLIGIHIFVLFFGLQTGSILFINRDDSENLMGDITPFLYTSKITPTTQKKFVQLFILKDIAYYTLLILAPIAIGLYPLFSGVDMLFVGLSLIGMFLFGMGVSISGISLYYRYGSIGFTGVLLGLLLLLTGGNVLTGSFLGLTPAGLFHSTEMVVSGTIIGWILSIGLPVIGSYLYTPRTNRTQTKIEGNRFMGDTKYDALTLKQYLDVKRSSGGIGKVIFSYVIFLLLALGMLVFIEPVQTYISHSLFLAIVLSMGAFTTYTWINQSDSISEYLIHPIDLNDVIKSKFYLFSVFTVIPTVIIVAIATVWMGEWAIGPLAIATVIGLTVYTYSVTVYFAGFSPHEFLFDASRFMGFSMAISLPLIPLLIISLFFPPTLHIGLYLGVLVYVAILGVVGYVLMDRTAEMWRDQLNISI